MFDWAGVSYSKVSIVEIGTSRSPGKFPNTIPNKTTLTELGKSIDDTFFDTINTQTTTMVKGGRGGAGCGTKPGRGSNKSRKSADTTGVPKHSGELGACKDLDKKFSS